MYFWRKINGKQLFANGVKNVSTLLKTIFNYFGIHDYDTYPNVEELLFYGKEKENIINQKGKDVKGCLKI